MRNIEFRGQRIDNGGWVYGFIIGDMEKWFILCKEKEKDFRLTWFEVKLETIGQCAGLQDKHGKKIFEGDILYNKTGYGDGRFVVKYIISNCSFCAEFAGISETEMYDMSATKFVESEVVGNQFEDTELMKE